MDLDGAVAAIAERQHSLITSRQAMTLGMSRSQIRNRKVRGIWEQVRFGVYRIRGAPRSWPQSVMSAVLAAGEVDHQTVALLGGTRGGNIGGALLAQHVDGLIDFSVGHGQDGLVIAGASGNDTLALVKTRE